LKKYTESLNPPVARRKTSGARRMNMIRKYFLVFVLCTFALSNPLLASSSPDAKIVALLNKLAWASIKNASVTVFQPPQERVRKQVRKELLAIARKSTTGRAAVVKIMIRVLEDPGSRGEGIFPYRWLTAVYLLGELRAVEGIDALIKNLDFKGQNGIVLSINIRPVSNALIKIGSPAIPKLKEALSNTNPEISSEAAGTLNEIQAEDRRR